MNQLTIIKIGGNVIDNSAKLHQFLLDFTALPGDKILVHGGGKIATELGESLGIKLKWSMDVELPILKPCGL